HLSGCLWFGTLTRNGRGGAAEGSRRAGSVRRPRQPAARTGRSYRPAQRMKAEHAGKQRLDQLLVERGLTDSREKARRLILAGSVLVNGQKRDKPGENVGGDSRVELLDRPRFVSRGGLKLEAAIQHFHIGVPGKICLDVGASTGGFTDCLLQHGAARV